MSLFRKEEESTPLGILLIVLGFAAIAVSMPGIFTELDIITGAGFTAGTVTLLGGIMFALGVKIILSGLGVLMQMRGAVMSAFLDLVVAFKILLVAFYLGLGDPMGLVVLAALIFIGFCFWLMKGMMKPFGNKFKWPK